MKGEIHIKDGDVYVRLDNGKEIPLTDYKRQAADKQELELDVIQAAVFVASSVAGYYFIGYLFS